MKIDWEGDKCSHAGICVKTLPNVFKIEDGHFCIDPKAADQEEIREVVARCPSGALTFKEMK